MVELKIRRIGNSLGVVLPKDVVGRLHTGEGGVLYLAEVPDGSFRLSAHDPGFRERMEKADDIVERYRNTLHSLAR